MQLLSLFRSRPVQRLALATDPEMPMHRSFQHSQSPARHMPAGVQRSVIICFSHLRWDLVFQRPQHINMDQVIGQALSTRRKLEARWQADAISHLNAVAAG